MKCFVIMPFGNAAQDPDRARMLDQIYTNWIKPTVEAIVVPGTSKQAISCYRADKGSRPIEIIVDVVENLLNADIVIADLTGRNPNVFYELGVRHAVGNNTILLAQNIDDIPFDLRAQRTIAYQYNPEGMLQLKASITNAILEILSQPTKIDNPVRRFLYEREVNRMASQPVPPGYDVLRDIISQMSGLKEQFERQLADVRHIMNIVTSPQSNTTHDAKPQIDLKFFEGVWKARPTGSMCYAKVVNGQLFMPYCYGDNNELTAHYYNCRIIGKTLFARFEWFDLSVSGYGVYDVVSDDRLEGGWWYAQDVPDPLRADITKISANVPGMTKMSMRRVSGVKKWPDWAQRYFDEMAAI